MVETKTDCRPWPVTTILTRLEALIGPEHISPDYVRFRINVLTAQSQVRRALASSDAASLRRPRPAGQTSGCCESGPQRSSSQGPPLGAHSIRFERPLLRSLLTALQKALVQYGRQDQATRRLSELAEAEPGLLEELARKAAFGPDYEYLEPLSRRAELPVEALVLFGRVLAAPFVTAAAEGLSATPETAKAERSEDVAGQVRAGCPVCGSLPGIARLDRPDGARTLCCSLCGRAWPFPRLACPQCGSRDQKSLGFLRITESDPRWIETCEKCRGYIKTVDARRLPEQEPIIPLVEEAATLHLDLLAEKEGYARRLPYAAMT